MSIKFKVKKNVTLPILKLNAGNTYYLKFTEPMFKGKEIENDTMENSEPVTLLNCINLDGGEEVQIVVASVLESIIKEHYEGEDYVGPEFAITKHPKKDGKRYHQYSLQEIEVEA